MSDRMTLIDTMTHYDSLSVNWFNFDTRRHMYQEEEEEEVRH